MCKYVSLRYSTNWIRSFLKRWFDFKLQLRIFLTEFSDDITPKTWECHLFFETFFVCANNISITSILIPIIPFSQNWHKTLDKTESKSEITKKWRSNYCFFFRQLNITCLGSKIIKMWRELIGFSFGTFRIADIGFKMHLIVTFCSTLVRYTLHQERW